MSYFRWGLLLTAIATTFIAVAAPVRAAYTGPIFVAPNGNDTAEGSEKKPLRTIEAAQAMARVRHLPSSDRDVVVRLREGTYYLKNTLQFDKRDSFTQYQGIGNVTISGGEPITGWHNVGGNRWETTVPGVKEGKRYFEQLYVGDVRRYRPRLPKKGYYYIAGSYPATEKLGGKGYDRFRFRPGEIHADWYDLAHVQVLPFHIWEMSRFPIALVDAAMNIVSLIGRTNGDASYAGFPAGNRYLIENVREALTEPGEWYLDAATGKLTYLAEKGEELRKLPVIAPRLSSLVEVTGATKLQFTHIRFSHSAYETPATGHSTGQADSDIPAAITVYQSKSFRLEHCVVTHTGGYGIWFRTGSKSCSVFASALVDLGAGGIKIGEMDAAKSEEDTVSGNTVAGCRIVGGGRIHPAGVGVWIGLSQNNDIHDSEIADFYYSGVSIGWHWGYDTTAASGNNVSHCYIHTIGQRVLSDMGGIYTLGGSDHSKLIANRIADINAFSYGGWGIYFDEGTTDVTARNNLVYNCSASPFHQHYGKNNLLLDNGFAYGQEAQLMRTRAEDHLSFTAKNNVIVYKDGALLGSNWSGGGSGFILDNNLYWREGGKPLLFPGDKKLEEWQRTTGQDRNSLIASPLFIDAARGDFRFPADSPVSTIWNKETRQKVGPDERSFVGMPVPVSPMAFPPGTPPPPITAITENWEDQSVGASPESPTLQVLTEPETPAATVRITDETAATGKHALKITDASGQKFSYSPHFFWQPKFDKGTVTGNFSLRWEKGAVLWHEWRTYANGTYTVGPHLVIDSRGTLTASGKTIIDLPAGQWVRFEVICPVGTTANGTYDLTVHLPGRTPPLRFTALPCQDGKAFSRLDWWGFIANGNDPATFYMDDIALTTQTK